MPELPEVETIRRQLEKEIVGKKIVKVVYDTGKMLKPAPAQFVNGVLKRQVVGIDRKAKLIIIDLDNGSGTAVHLKLNGRLLYREQDQKDDQYIHVKLLFSDGTELRFADSRKFGYMQWLKNPEEKASIISGYGLEPMVNLTKDSFHKIIRGSNRRIKDLLMDQSIIAGVGNIYANESLWMARVHPETKASKLSSIETDRLFEALIEVLAEALEQGGSSDQWYRQIHGEIGHYQEHFKVYNRKGKSCLRHSEEKILYLKISQRGSFICPKCQKKK